MNKLITLEGLKTFLDELNKKYGAEFYTRHECDTTFAKKEDIHRIPLQRHIERRIRANATSRLYCDIRDASIIHVQSDNSDIDSYISLAKIPIERRKTIKIKQEPYQDGYLIELLVFDSKSELLAKPRMLLPFQDPNKTLTGMPKYPMNSVTVSWGGDIESYAGEDLIIVEPKSK